MRRAFTLIELMVIIAIIMVMSTLVVSDVRSGQGAARVRGATRDIMAQIRRARSAAMVTQQPVYITYASETTDGEVQTSVTVKPAAVTNHARPPEAWTLGGEKVKLEEDAAEGEFANGRTPFERLYKEGIDAEVTKGIRLLVTRDTDAEAEAYSVEQRRGHISGSAFLDGQKLLDYNGESTLPGTDDALDAKADQSPVTIRWETNGRTEPHTVRIFADGEKPSSGLLVRIDAFGAIKEVSGDDRS